MVYPNHKGQPLFVWITFVDYGDSLWAGVKFVYLAISRAKEVGFQTILGVANELKGCVLKHIGRRQGLECSWSPLML